MSEQAEKILSQALTLAPDERAQLIDRLLSSLEFPPSKSIDEMWAQEAEDRIDAYERGELTAIPAKEVFDKIRRK